MKYNNMTDSGLVALARQKDQQAYKKIYERYEKPVRNCLARFFSVLGDDIDDIVTESFQKFFTKLDSFDSSRELLPWLSTIATRTALDHLSAMKREDEKKENIKKTHGDIAEEPTDTSPSLEDELIYRQEHERLMQFIGELPLRYRDIISKYMVEELEYEEIARQTELPLNTVRTRIRRGKAKLAEMMTRGEIK